MADGIAVDNGALTDYDVHTNEEAIGGATKHVQRVKADGGTAGSEGQTTVSNTSTTIVAARDTRHAVLIVNRQTVAVYLSVGGATATTSMFRLDPGESLTTDSKTAITAITAAAYSASGDAKVHYAETYDA